MKILTPGNVLLLEKLIVAYLVKIFSACDGTQRFMNMFQFNIGSCPEPDESSPHSFSLRSVLRLFSSLCLLSSKCFLLFRFFAHNLCAFLFLTHCTACPPNVPQFEAHYVYSQFSAYLSLQIQNQHRNFILFEYIDFSFMHA